MRILDTNILVRVLLQEDTPSTKAAQRVITDIIQGVEKAVIPTLVVSEVLYVLSGTVYTWTKKQTIQWLQLLVQIKNIDFEEKKLIQKTLDIYSDNALAFTDCYLIAKTYLLWGSLDTLDKKLHKKYMQYIKIS